MLLTDSSSHGAQIDDGALADFQPTVRIGSGKKSPSDSDNDLMLHEVGDYRIVREIGRGGMGVVYEAEQKSLSRRVAVKILPFSISHNQQTLDRFRRESRSAAALHHTNIVPVYEVGQDGNICYYAMQFIEGRGLDELALDRSAADGSRADGSKSFYQFVAGLAEQVAHGLEYAHQRGILHRDVKPSNLLLDENNTVWITDFGLAKGAGDCVTQSGELIGTLHYMAPERFRGEGDHRADVYALGITLYEILLQRQAFVSSDYLEVIDQIQNSTPPSPRKIDANVPRDLEVIILKAIDKIPNRRYQSAAELAEDLHRFQADEPIKARPIGPFQRVVRAARRNPRMAALIGVVTMLALILVVGAVVAAAFFHRLAAENGQQAELAKQAEKAATKAKQLAQSEAERANQQTETAKEISTFLLTIIEESDPLAMTGVGFGQRKLGDHRLTPLELLDQCAKKLRKAFVDKPAVRAALLDRIGSAYLSFGRISRAKPLVLEALEIRRKLHKGDHPDLADSLQHFGWCHHARHERKIALDALNQSLEMRRRLFGVDHLAVAESLVYNGFMGTLNAFDPKTVENQIRTAMKITERHLGKKSREYGLALVVLVHFHLENKNFKKLLPLVAEAESLFEEIGGNTKPVAVIHSFMKGHVAESLGLYQQAMTHFRDVIKLGEPTLGESHFLVQKAHVAIGKLYYERFKDYPAAEKQYRRVIEILTKIKEGNSSTAADYMMHVGRALRNQERFAEAAEVMRKTVALLRKEGGDLARSLHIWAEVLFRDGKTSEAEAIMAKALKTREQSSGDKKFWHGRALEDYVIILIHNKKSDTAREALRFHLPFLDKQVKPDQEFALLHLRLCCRLAELTADVDETDAMLDKAVASLKKAVQLGFRDESRLRYRRYAALRQHPEYAEAVAAMKR